MDTSNRPPEDIIPGARGGFLIRTHKGERRNPHGRPKGRLSMVTILEKILKSKVAISDDGIKRKIKRSDALLLALTNKGIKGDVAAIREVINRMDGLPVQRNELSGIDGQPIELIIGQEEEETDDTTEDTEPE